MKKLLKLFLLLVIPVCIFSQQEEWTVFKSVPPPFRKLGPGSSSLSIIQNTPKNARIVLSAGGMLKNRMNWFDSISTNSNALPDNFIVCLSQDGKGNIWAGTFLGGVAKYDGTGWTAYNKSNSGLPDNKIYSMAFDKYKNLWLGTTSGLVKFDGTRWRVYNMKNSKIPAEIIYAVAVDEDGVKWIGTAAGLVKYDGRDWTTYNSFNSKLPDDNITAITIDKEGVKWIGTFEGLVRIDGADWRVFTTANSGLPYDDIYSIAYDERGKMFINTWGGGLVVLSNDKWTTYDTYTSGLPDNNVSSFLIDDNRNRWIGTLGGLAKYSEKKWSVFNSSNSKLPDNMVYSLLKDNRGNLWIGTTNGLAVYKEGGIITAPASISSFSYRVKRNTVSLFWQCGKGNSTYGFDIEKKADETEWKKIGFIKAFGVNSFIAQYSFTDNYPVSGKNLYRLKEIDNSGTYRCSGSIESFVGMPDSYFLEDCFPFPWNPEVLLKFGLPESAKTRLIIYDTFGREVKTLVNEKLEAGYHQGILVTKGLLEGNYFCKIIANNFTTVRKFFLPR